MAEHAKFDRLLSDMEAAHDRARNDLHAACEVLGLERWAGAKSLEEYPARIILEMARRLAALEARAAGDEDGP